MMNRRIGLKARLRLAVLVGLRRGQRMLPFSRLRVLDRDQWMALAAYRGLVHQAFDLRPLAPRVSAALWDEGAVHGLPAVLQSGPARAGGLFPSLRP
jgi:hypothetical protein